MRNFGGRAIITLENNGITVSAKIRRIEIVEIFEKYGQISNRNGVQTNKSQIDSRKIQKNTRNSIEHWLDDLEVYSKRSVRPHVGNLRFGLSFGRISIPSSKFEEEMPGDF